MRIKFFFYAIVCFWLPSCAPSYVPNLTNAPLLYQEKDYILGLHMAASGIDFQSAYAVSDGIGLMVNLSANPSSKESQYYLGEAGVGWYSVIDNKFHVEIFAGGGYGFGKAESTTNLFGSTIHSSEEGTYRRLFVQPDIGFHIKLFEMALALRLAQVNYTKFTKDDQVFDSPPKAFLYEPTVTMRFGFGGDGFFENKKLVLQVGGSSAFNDDVVFDNGSIIVGVGLIYRNRSYNTKWVY